MKNYVLALLLVLAGCASTSGAVDKTKMAEGYYMKGLSYLQDKNYELALVEFQRSVNTDSKNKLSYYALGLVNDMQGKLKEAESFYRESIDIDSDFSEAYNAIGVVYFKQQKWKEALKSFRKALDNKLYTTPHIPYLNMGDLYMAQKDYERAADAYLESKRYVNQDIAILKLGTALLEAGRVKEAIAELEEGTALNQKSAGMWYTLALARLKDGNKKAAIADFKKAADLAPGTEISLKAKDYLKTLR